MALGTLDGRADANNELNSKNPGGDSGQSNFACDVGQILGQDRYTGTMAEILPVGAFMARVRRLTRQLAGVNEALSEWDEWLADRYLPPDLQRHPPRPGVGYDDLKELQEELISQLGEIEGDFVGRN